MSCECLSWAGCGDISWGKHHHVNCEKYSTNKYPYLFYYEEAVDAWVPAPVTIEHLIVVDDQLENGEEMEIRFRRVDMTDKEINELPED